MQDGRKLRSRREACSFGCEAALQNTPSNMDVRLEVLLDSWYGEDVRDEAQHVKADSSGAAQQQPALDCGAQVVSDAQALVISTVSL